MIRKHYDVYLSGDQVHRIAPTHGDDLRAELEGAKRGINPSQHPLNFGTVSIWCCLARLGLTTLKYPDFVEHELIDFLPVAEEAVDPTQPAGPSGPASPSPATSPPAPAPASTGSTPIYPTS